MAGYSAIYVIGGLGGFLGADGVNPIELLILVGEADRRWLEPHYFDGSMHPMAGIQRLIPPRPDDPDLLLDACLAFAPRYFESCTSLARVSEEARGFTSLDFHGSPGRIPASWSLLREEARTPFHALAIWRADLVRVNHS